jgi:biopolymer transport protein ExbD
MVSTTFTKETHLEIDLPEANGDKSPVVEKQIEVVVNAQGGLTVNGKALINKQMNTLSRAIERESGGDTELPFIITGDANASYQAIVSVMDLAGQMGFVNLSMTTRAPAEGAE